MLLFPAKVRRSEMISNALPCLQTVVRIGVKSPEKALFSRKHERDCTNTVFYRRALLRPPVHLQQSSPILGCCTRGRNYPCNKTPRRQPFASNSLANHHLTPC